MHVTDRSMCYDVIVLVVRTCVLGLRRTRPKPTHAEKMVGEE